jgi:AAA15 family ATPase/GTPase
MDDITIFTGKNDAGKSNVLKALNLFFNNETESDSIYDFTENFNFKRLDDVRKDSIKGKQFIQIKVTFSRGKQYEKTLPSKFTITKKWLRDSSQPIVSDDVARRLTLEGKKYNERSTASLTRFINKINYYYIPAIKDNKLFSQMLEALRNTIYNEKLIGDVSLNESMKVLFNKVADSAADLSEEFKKATNIVSMFATPESIDELYKAMVIITKSENNTVRLDKRGDGIRVRYIPSILNYIATNANSMCIWGFEEPENSLEFNLAHQMAMDFANLYSKNSMILLTSHSPAFINLESYSIVTILRCFKVDSITNIPNKKALLNVVSIEEELGYAKILQEQYNVYLQKIEELRETKSLVNSLQSELDLYHKPVLLTEGKTDVSILTEAWKRLYDTECPFLIKSCNIYDETDDVSSAGCGTLSFALRSHRFDSNYVIVGLFDRDTEGLNSYKLDDNFKLDSTSRWKKHRNGRAYALPLPIPIGKEVFAEFSNLCIEYYFEKQYLSTEIDGKRLKLKPIPIVQRVRSIEIGKTMPTEEMLHCFEIERNTKNFFASKIVPTFPDEAFIPFKILFETVNEILSDTGYSNLEIASSSEEVQAMIAINE